LSSFLAGCPADAVIHDRHHGGVGAARLVGDSLEARQDFSGACLGVWTAL
jgi:hypothetical protein